MPFLLHQWQSRFEALKRLLYLLNVSSCIFVCFYTIHRVRMSYLVESYFCILIDYNQMSSLQVELINFLPIIEFKGEFSNNIDYPLRKYVHFSLVTHSNEQVKQRMDITSRLTRHNLIIYFNIYPTFKVFLMLLTYIYGNHAIYRL